MGLNLCWSLDTVSGFESLPPSQMVSTSYEFQLAECELLAIDWQLREGCHRLPHNFTVIAFASSSSAMFGWCSGESLRWIRSFEGFQRQRTEMFSDDVQGAC